MTLSEENHGRGRWITVHRPPALTVDELHVWRVHLPAGQFWVELARRILAPDELDRAAKFHQRRDRDRFIAVHGAMRCILSRYVAAPPESHVFRTGQWGKPYLYTSLKSTPCFNLSQSGDVAVLAMTLGADVGVDVEQIRQIMAEASIADRSFSQADRRLYHAALASERTGLFFRLWTCHEAKLKAMGLGLVSDAVNLASHQDEMTEWTIEHFVPAMGYSATVAASASINRIRYLHFVWENSDLPS